MSDTEANYVGGLAMRWAGTDPMEQWVNAAPEGGRTLLEETIREYLGSHNPFPDESAVEVLGRDGSTWEQAVIVERVGLDEWTVEYEDGEQAWRDHHELRGPDGFPTERAPSMGEITMEAYIADMRDEVQAAVAEGLLEVRPAEEALRTKKQREVAEAAKDREAYEKGFPDRSR